MAWLRKCIYRMRGGAIGGEGVRLQNGIRVSPFRKSTHCSRSFHSEWFFPDSATISQPQVEENLAWVVQMTQWYEVEMKGTFGTGDTHDTGWATEGLEGNREGDGTRGGRQVGLGAGEKGRGRGRGGAQGKPGVGASSRFFTPAWIVWVAPTSSCGHRGLEEDGLGTHEEDVSAGAASMRAPTMDRHLLDRRLGRKATPRSTSGGILGYDMYAIHRWSST